MGGFVVKTVSVFLLRTIGMKGMCHSFTVLSYHPHIIACPVTNTFVSLVLYMLISLSSKTVMYPASAILGMLRREFLVMVGTMCISLASWRMSCGSLLMVSPTVRVPSGS